MIDFVAVPARSTVFTSPDPWSKKCPAIPALSRKRQELRRDPTSRDRGPRRARYAGEPWWKNAPSWCAAGAARSARHAAREEGADQTRLLRAMKGGDSDWCLRTAW
jgi:hypothetical protein